VYVVTNSCVGFEVLIVVVMKSSIFWNITPCTEEHVASIFRVKDKPSKKLHETGRKQTNSRHDQDNQRGHEKGVICGGVGKNGESSKGVCGRQRMEEYGREAVSMAPCMQ
jgi:hypothetical protein